MTDEKLLGLTVIDLTPETPEGFDESEEVRRRLVSEINPKEIERGELEKLHGQVWDTNELRGDFEVDGFLAPYIVVRRRADGVRGTLLFQHWPRFYWGWAPESGRSG